MQINKKHLEEAVNANIISDEQAAQLIDFLQSQSDVGPSFNFTPLP